jgi:DNA-binding winged helix-turn-helix (wHTH) protein/tetratricopeptide (TPR) repeat protein/TolB-like protein
LTQQEIYEFGPFRLDVGEHALLQGERAVALKPKVFETLVLLVRNAGHLLSKQELMSTLWPDAVVDETNLNKNIWLIRRALGEGDEASNYIDTIPRVGYRFVARVRKVEAPAKEILFPVTPLPPPSEPGSNASLDTPSRAIGMAAAAVAAEATNAAPLEESAPDDAPFSPPSASRYRRFISVAAVVAVAVLIVFAWSRGRSATVPPPLRRLAAPPVALRKSVAILGFRNSSGRAGDAWLATACSEMLATELALGDRLRLVSAEDVANLRMASPWPVSGTLSPATTERIGVALDGDLLVLGSYATVGLGERSRLRLDVRLQDARTGEILLEAAETGDSQELFPLVSRLGAKLREQLGVSAVPDTDAHLVLATLPSVAEAARLYSLGLEKLRERDALAARDLLEGATRLEPAFPLGHAMLARAWGQLGYETKRREEARKARDLAARLSPMNRLLVEGDYDESLADHAKAVSAYRTLFELYPDRVDFGLQLVAAQISAGQDAAARETIGRLRRLPSPISEDPLIDLAESSLVPNHSVPDVLLLIRSAKRKASERGLRLVFAQALKRECRCLIYSDRPDSGVTACQQAYGVFLEAGNRLEAADSLRLIADRLSDQGKYREAIAEYERALAILRELGEDEKTGAVLNNMAIDFTNMGELDRAEDLYRQARGRFEKAGEWGNAATALSNVADITFMRGQLPHAIELFEQVIEIRSVPDPSESAYAVYRLADVFLAQGRIEEARSRAAKAVELIRPIEGSYPYLTGAMMVLGDVRRAEGDLADARKEYEASLELQEKTGLMVLVAESQTALAAIELDERRPDRAEPLLRKAVAQFEKEGGSPDAAAAYVLLSRALLMEGKVEEARSAAQHGTDMSRRSLDPMLRIPAAIQSARVEAAGGQRSGAASTLRTAVEEARRLGYYGIECEARLALGELELRSSLRAGRARLEVLAKESRDRGFGLVARQAEALLRSSGSS